MSQTMRSVAEKVSAARQGFVTFGGDESQRLKAAEPAPGLKKFDG
jgi:hypothetical protein